jgi:hypothetical protein
MDLSKSILSGQYNNVMVGVDNLNEIRGTGQYSTSYPLSSNWNPGVFQPDMSTYVQQLGLFDQKEREKIEIRDQVNISDLMPVSHRKNDQFVYTQTLNNTLRGDPYQEFGLKATNTTPTTLNMLYFNKVNVKYISKRIIDEVYNITGIRIKPQSENSILVIMNNKFQYGLAGGLPVSPVHLALPRGEKNIPLEERLTRLNQAVIQECVKEVLSGMNMYAEYYKQASSLPMPLEHPTLMTMKGRNVLSENIGFTKGNSDSISSFNLRNNVVN